MDEQFLETWQNPTAPFRCGPFWSWNGRLEIPRLERAIEEMKQAGMGGFFMHSRYGLKTPYLSAEWFQCVSACIEKARQLGMKAYLYDEDRWPSGFAGGLVTRQNPGYRMLELVATPGKADAQAVDHLATFAVELDGNRQLKSYRRAADASAADAFSFDAVPLPDIGWFNGATYLDVMNPDAVAEFIRLTHQAYADRYGKDFGDLIPAIFFDEPNYGAIQLWQSPQHLAVTWSHQLPQQFKSRRGYDLLDRLPEVFFASPAGQFSKVRYDYYRTVTELFVESFTQQIGRWCGDHRIALTGHMLEEPTLISQAARIGAAMPHYEHMQWPGIDILTDQTSELSTAKQCSSVAAQLGKPRVLSELYAATGWDWPLEGHKFQGDWQFACGVNFRCPHLTHYSLAGGAKRDYPASIFTHSPWWKYYRVVEEYFGRLSFMLTQGRPLRDVLVIHPIESAWGLMGPEVGEKDSTINRLDRQLQSLVRALSCSHYDWDYADESMLERHGSVAAGAFAVGQMSYQLVIVPPCVTLRANTVALLGRFLAGGGRVLLAGQQPSMIAAQPSDEIQRALSGAGSCEAEGPAVVAAVEAALPRRIAITQDGRECEAVWHMLRAAETGQVLFVQSHDRAVVLRLHVSVTGHGPVALWDACSGERTRIGSVQAGERVEFDLSLPPTGSALITLGQDVQACTPAPRTLQSEQAAEGPYRIELTEPNTLPLDFCRYRIGEAAWSGWVPSIRADNAVRRHFGLHPRNDGMHQPWYLYATGVVDLTPRGRCQIQRTFHVSNLPPQCLLALEQPENYTITLNGKPVAAAASGHWVDEDIKTIDITPLLRTGENELLFDFNYRADMELEDMYLAGDFGVGLRDATKGRVRDNLTMMPATTRLSTGSWVGQGLDFYGGSVLYRMSVSKPLSGRLVVSLPGVACTVAAVIVGEKAFPMPWRPFEADITDALSPGENEIAVEVVGGRKNILGPLHVPWQAWTGPGEFDPGNGKWRGEYLLTDHGLTLPVRVKVMK